MARDVVVLNGAEVIVETGTGLVEKFDRTPGKRNAHVAFKATHTNLRDPVTGWLDTFNDELVAVVEQAFDERFELEYRIEVRRHENVDPSTPIADLKSRDKVRDLVLVRPVRGAGAESTPPPAEPAPEPPAPPSPEPEPEEPAAEQEAPAQDDTSRPTSKATPRRGPKMTEARPWEELNSDGSPNLGSYAVQAAAGMVDLAVELLAEAERPPTAPATKFLALRLLEAADEIQAGVRPDGRHDRMDNSHTRARGVLRTVIRVAPFPIDAMDKLGHVDPNRVDDVHAWHERVVKAGVVLLGMSLELSGVDWRTA